MEVRKGWLNFGTTENGRLILDPAAREASLCRPQRVYNNNAGKKTESPTPRTQHNNNPLKGARRSPGGFKPVDWFSERSKPRANFPAWENPTIR